jgi:uncharacterized protein YhaN
MARTDAEPDGDLVAELYRQPLDRFVQSRTELVRRLRTEGRDGDAQGIAKLRKPSTQLWALNQLGAVAADDLGALYDAGDNLRAAQQRLLSGDREAADDLRAATQQQRHRADVLARRAGMVLTANGHAAADTLIRDLGAALASASVSTQEVREALAGGWLLADPGPAGFPEPDDSVPAQATRRVPAPPRDDRLRAAEIEVNKRESEARLAREAADRRQAEADNLDAQARAAATAARTAVAKAEAAEAALQQALSQLESVRQAAPS